LNHGQDKALILNAYRVFCRAVLLAALAYSVVANYTWVRQRSELFPIFAWELFSYIPSEVTDYGLLITAVDGRPLTPPDTLSRPPVLYRSLTLSRPIM
jgi:hypothetical protein